MANRELLRKLTEKSKARIVDTPATELRQKFEKYDQIIEKDMPDWVKDFWNAKEEQITDNYSFEYYIVKTILDAIQINDGAAKNIEQTKSTQSPISKAAPKKYSYQDILDATKLSTVGEPEALRYHVRNNAPNNTSFDVIKQFIKEEVLEQLAYEYERSKNADSSISNQPIVHSPTMNE